MSSISLAPTRWSRGQPGFMRTHDRREVQALAASIFGPTRVEPRSVPGNARAALQAVRIGSVLLAQIDYGGPVEVIADTPKPLFVAQTILSGRIGGRSETSWHDRGTTLMYSPGNAFQLSLSERCKRFCVVVEPARLEGLNLDRSAAASLALPAMEGSSAAGLRWRALVDYLAVEMQLRLDGSALMRPDGESRLEDYILAALAACLAPSELAPGDGAASPPGYFMRALDFVQAHPHRAVTIAELAAHCRVSARMLQLTFARFKGMTPMAFARLQRLKAARAALQCEPAARGAVTRIALDHGFSHLGEFAGAYRQLFGESPSDTLHRRARAA